MLLCNKTCLDLLKILNKFDQLKEQTEKDWSFARGYASEEKKSGKGGYI